MTQTELKPCPFCGGEAEMRNIGNEYTKTRGTKVWCSKCQVAKTVKAIRNTLAWTESHAIAAWDTRTITPAEAAQVLLDAGCSGVAALTWGIDRAINGEPSYPVGDAGWEAPDGNAFLHQAVESALRALTEGAKP